MKHLIAFLVCFATSWQSIAQKPLYVDYKPSYLEWNKRYILDKITYTKDRTIFHFRYAAFSLMSSMSFHGILSEDQWTLVSTANPQEVFEQIELRKVTKEGVVLHESYKGEYLQFATKPYEIYTVEVHFPKLPKHITEVDFLEGVRKRSYTNHFHCFNVRVKPQKDPDLGTKEDLKARIDAFEIRTIGWTKTSSGHIHQDKENIVEAKPKPKPEIKPEPEAKPKPP